MSYAVTVHAQADQPAAPASTGQSLNQLLQGDAAATPAPESSTAGTSYANGSLAAKTEPASAPAANPAKSTQVKTTNGNATTGTQLAQHAGAHRPLEEIVVTAQRRAENIQDVPISVQAFSSDKLSSMGIDNPQQLQRITPGLVYSDSAIGYALVYIRGVGTDVFIPSADSSVASYIDGVYLPYAHGLASQFLDVQRVEVLKGPQGTLFGRNTTGGAIRIITRDPSSQFNVKVQGTFANFDKKGGSAYISGPLTDDFSASLAAFYQHQDSYYKAVPQSPVQHRPTDEQKGAHLKLRYKITDDLTLNLSGLITQSHSGLVNSIEDTKPAGLLFRPMDTPPYRYDSNVNGFLKSDNDIVYGDLVWRSDAMNVKLFGSNEQVRSKTLYDFDGGPNSGVYFDVPDEFVHATTAEFQLQSVPDGWLTFSNTVDWTLGYYYFHSNGGYGNVNFGVLAPTGSNLTFSDLGILVPPALQGSGIPLSVNGEVNEQGVVSTVSHAIYGQTTWKPLDWFGLTLGARYQGERRGTVVSDAQLAITRQPGGQIPLFVYPHQSTTNYNFSPKVELEFHPFGQGTLLYVSWQKGFKSGTYNVVSLNLPPSYVKPEKVTSYEAGIKGSLFDSSVTYSAAVFENKIDNLQALAISLTSGGTSQLYNAAHVTIKGVEANVNWQPLPDALPDLVLNGGATYLHGVYDSFPNGFGFDPVTGLYFGPNALVPTPPRDFTGNTTIRTPKFTADLGLNYGFDIFDGRVDLGADASYDSGFFFDPQNTARQPEYVLVGAHASYLYRPWNIKVSVFGQNLTNKLYFSDKLITDFGPNAYDAPPRTYGLTLSWSYGS